MKLQHVVQEVYFGVWAITREGWGAINAIVKSKLDDSIELPKADSDPDTDIWGNALEKFELIESDFGNVAVIPVAGTLIHHASLLEKQCGACSYDDIQRDLMTASKVPNLEKAVLKISSPGGMCMGNQETASMISRMREGGMRIEAVTDSDMCSAAYNLAAGCNSIACTPTAQVGSIGVLAPFLDQSMRFEMQGLKMDMITSGPLKGTGWPGTSLTEEQRAYMQGTVDKYAGMFKDHVRSYRPVREDAMQGQVFIGSSAMDAGLVDRIVESIGGGMCVDSEELSNGY